MRLGISVEVEEFLDLEKFLETREEEVVSIESLRKGGVNEENVYPVTGARLGVRFYTLRRFWKRCRSTLNDKYNRFKLTRTKPFDNPYKTRVSFIGSF